jgi:predicted alpha-1,2-mannosidase
MFWKTIKENPLLNKKYMKRKGKFFCYLKIVTVLFFGTTSLTSAVEKGTKTPIDYVNPFIGNISHLLVPTYPMVHLPNSMLRVCPERGDYTTDLINGLPVAITSHRGSSAFNISAEQGDESSLVSVKHYSYDLEKIVPYRYSVYLDDAQIKVDYAPSNHSGLYKLTFEKQGKNFIVINVGNGSLKSDSGCISGYQLIDGGPTKIYLYMETEQQPQSVGALEKGKVSYALKSVDGHNKAIVLNYGNSNEIIHLRYGISFISAEQAKKNLRKEIENYDVDRLAQTGRDIWNHTLQKIQVEGNSENDKTVFYTSLYRTYERMINISEDGKYYSAFDGKVHDDGGNPFYTDDWVWDTYRATHPLRVLIEPEMEKNMVQSYIRMAEQSPKGWMPTFPEVTGDSHRMNGNHAVAVIWDAYSKGIEGINLENAYKACKAALTEKSLLPWTKVPLTELDKFYNEKGYYPALKPGEAETCPDVNSGEKRQPVALTLGNSYDVWCLAQMAKALNKMDDYNFFMKRSYNYRNLFNSETSFFHPRDAAGNFILPFDYRFSGGGGARDYYDENNGWTYRWDVQHNVADLIQLMGGAEKFANNLDATFREPLGKSKYDFYFTLPDNTGNVGQFTMANEPSLHIPYLYNYAGQPWKTQKRIRQLLKYWFRNDLMGVPGDEDGGGMTAFVVFSSIGFYPVTPGSSSYNIGSPLFKDVKVRLGNGKVFEVAAKNCSDENKYIQSATLNGNEWNKPWFNHSDIENGGSLVLIMGDKANKNWGSNLKDAPPSASPVQ